MKLTPEGRRELVNLIESGNSKLDVCKKFGISRPTLDKWLKRYYTDGLKGLDDNVSTPKSSPNRTPQDIKEKVIKISIEFPDLGAGSLVQKLSKLDVRISAPTIQSILTQAGRSTQWDRFQQNLNEYNNEPNTLSDDTLKRMEIISKNFKYRSLFTKKPGQHVFLWHESCHVTGSNKKIPLFIFLDMFGLFIHVYYPQNSLKRFRTHLVPNKIGSHRLTDPTIKILESTYKTSGLQLKELTFSSLAPSSGQILQQELLDYNVKVSSLAKSDFYQLPFINQIRSIIRSNIKKPLKLIHFRGRQLITEIEILELIQLFHNNYNKKNAITEYPSLGMSPYDYLARNKHQNIVNRIIDITNEPLNRKKALAKKYNLI